MKSWQKERRNLEQAISIAGVLAAYNLIPTEMPIKEWPKKLIEYHEQKLLREATPEISPASEARKARIDELRRDR